MTWRKWWAHSPCLFRQLLITVVYSAAQLSSTTAVYGPELHRETAARQLSRKPDLGPSLAHNRSHLELAAAYMDSLLADPVAARSRLCGNFTKRSRVAVVYMCFNRTDMIERAIPAVLRSEGLNEFDLFISQDGGTASIFRNELISNLEDTRYVYIHHPENMCAGMHHYFIKAFAFDIMSYETLLVIEEDNVVHPQALQLLARMAELSVSEPSIGAVSILDMDMSAFLDASRFGAGIIPTIGSMGHLWVFGLHHSKYEPARGCLRDYYNAIKGHDYRWKHHPPLRDAIQALQKEKGFPLGGALSQDRWFLNSLAKYGFIQRYNTLFRFFEPIGNYGLHYRLNESEFYGRFGHGMFSGRISDPAAAFDVTKDSRHIEAMKEVVRARLASLYAKYLGSSKLSEKQVNNTFNGLIEGRLNGLSHVRGIIQRGFKSPPQASQLNLGVQFGSAPPPPSVQT